LSTPRNANPLTAGAIGGTSKTDATFTPEAAFMPARQVYELAAAAFQSNPPEDPGIALGQLASLAALRRAAEGKAGK
jgi:hypothetical protein